ncbi:4958_t:CDS:2 [Ambispora gerdemannii]|uniref:4958_t:CDS:1 n=1 Tax=Ambispora gerdemannii TaxID=144530 RepID=A0A9N8ZM09_9GLOM|nr:4958_t:CDS:2 [Ambispora gerdemannii]
MNFASNQVHYNDGQYNTRNFDSPNKKRDPYLSQQTDQSIIIDLTSKVNKLEIKFKSSKTNEEEYFDASEEENYTIYDNDDDEIDEHDYLMEYEMFLIDFKIESRHGVCNNNKSDSEKFSAPEFKIDTSYLSPPDENREIMRKQWPQMDVENIDPRYLCPPGWHIRRMQKMFFEHRREYRSQMRGFDVDKE